MLVLLDNHNLYNTNDDSKLKAIRYTIGNLLDTARKIKT